MTTTKKIKMKINGVVREGEREDWENGLSRGSRWQFSIPYAKNSRREMVVGVEWNHEDKFSSEVLHKLLAYRAKIAVLNIAIEHLTDIKSRFTMRDMDNHEMLFTVTDCDLSDLATVASQKLNAVQAQLTALKKEYYTYVRTV